MKSLLFPLLGVLLLLSSCQKEVSTELQTPGKGFLQSSSGDCLPKLVKGNYVVGQALTDSNYIEVTIEVATLGSYTVKTDTVNGYSFTGTGSFPVLGPNVIRLKGSGTPSAIGTDLFNVSFDSSVCAIQIDVVAGGSSGGTAAFTLQPGTGSACGVANVSGNYTVGTPLGNTNTLTLGVVVTTPGTWTFSTTTVDGFSFTGSGTFTSAGTQTIFLNGTGTPTAGGTQTFPVTAGGSNCSFTVNVAGGTTPANTDYFPLTANSYWTYDIDGDTAKAVNNYSATKGGNLYRGFIQTDQSGAIDTSYFRKDASGNYYNYQPTSDLPSTIPIVFTSAGLDVLFLKQTLTTGATWNSDHAGTISGLPATLRFKFTAVDANASVTINGNNFTNVYRIAMDVQLGVLGTFNPTGIVIEFYYAKGIGLIRQSDGTSNQTIRFWQVF